METINLFILDMTQAGNTSGVDRYVDTLLKGLEAYPFIHVHWIHLIHDSQMLFHSEMYLSSYLKIIIPLPQQLSEIINESFWTEKYNEQVYRLVKHLFEKKKNRILHLHTLNLIDLAVYIREQVECKIITHLHCIPWKGLYNSNIRLFNHLYKLYYVDSLAEINSHNFISDYELRSYIATDHIICVTRCAADFLNVAMKNPLPKISIIPNGIDDLFHKEIREKRMEKKVFKLLYVGVLSQSKGLDFILKAIREVGRRGYKVSLTVVGKGRPAIEKRLKDENKDLALNFLGCISFGELTKYYKQCDTGIIASLQEQSSYVAIEMSMFGLPLITSAVDGLDEMFTDSVNALKVSISFSKVTGLKINTEEMADKIVMLIENLVLRKKLSENVRKLYEQDMTLDRMVLQTVLTYQKTIGGIDHE